MLSVFFSLSSSILCYNCINLAITSNSVASKILLQRWKTITTLWEILSVQSQSISVDPLLTNLYIFSGAGGEGQCGKLVVTWNTDIISFSHVKAFIKSNKQQTVYKKRELNSAQSLNISLRAKLKVLINCNYVTTLSPVSLFKVYGHLYRKWGSPCRKSCRRSCT